MRDRRQTSRIASLVVVFLCTLAIDAAAQQPSRREQDAAEPSLRTFHLNFNRFEIPFSVDPMGQRPVEVQLYVSHDAGKQWALYATQPVTGKSFLFEAPTDGQYWFATRTVDARGNAAPMRPPMTVHVDTIDPQVDLQARVVAAGPIVVSLSCVDAAPSADSIRIEYSIDQSQQWTPVADVSVRNEADQADRVFADAEFLPPTTWKQISVRAVVGDLAGNETPVTRQLDKPRVAVGKMRLATSKTPATATSRSPASDPAPVVADAREPLASSPSSPWAIPQFSVSSGSAPLGPMPVQIDTASSDPAAGPAGPELTAPLTSYSLSSSSGRPPAARPPAARSRSP